MWSSKVVDKNDNRSWWSRILPVLSHICWVNTHTVPLSHCSQFAVCHRLHVSVNFSFVIRFSSSAECVHICMCCFKNNSLDAFAFYPSWFILGLLWKHMHMHMYDCWCMLIPVESNKLVELFIIIFGKRTHLLNLATSGVCLCLCRAKRPVIFIMTTSIRSSTKPADLFIASLRLPTTNWQAGRRRCQHFTQVTTCVEKLEASGNFTAVREKSWNWQNVGGKSGKTVHCLLQVWG